MTDLEVIEIVRRHMLGVEHQLRADPPATSRQFALAMMEVAREIDFPDDPDVADTRRVLADLIKRFTPAEDRAARQSQP